MDSAAAPRLSRPAELRDALRQLIGRATVLFSDGKHGAAEEQLARLWRACDTLEDLDRECPSRSACVARRR
jgi:hypothetical protein